MATAIKKSEGRRIDYTPSSAVSAGDVVVIGELVGVATEDIAASTLGAIDVQGVFDMPKAVTSSSALTAGAIVYWDAGNQVVTTTASTHKTAGYTIEAATATAALVQVKLER
jgi:predicted RecA/RadA family phage recombinase